MSVLIEELTHDKFRYIWNGGEWFMLNRGWPWIYIGCFIQLRCKPSRHSGDNSLSIGQDIHMYRKIESLVYLPSGNCVLRLKSMSDSFLTNFLI